MKEINVAVIGSGSTYCPELVDGFIKAKDRLALKSLRLMDIDERKRTIVGSLCVRMLKNAGIDCEVTMTDSLDEALVGADFVVTQIRVGKLPARHLDETIPLKYDLIGQETTGGGFGLELSRYEADCGQGQDIAPTPGINYKSSGIIPSFDHGHKELRSRNVPINMIDDVKKAVGQTLT